MAKDCPALFGGGDEEAVEPVAAVFDGVVTDERHDKGADGGGDDVGHGVMECGLAAEGFGGASDVVTLGVAADSEVEEELEDFPDGGGGEAESERGKSIEAGFGAMDGFGAAEEFDDGEADEGGENAAHEMEEVVPVGDIDVEGAEVADVDAAEDEKEKGDKERGGDVDVEEAFDDEWKSYEGEAGESKSGGVGAGVEIGA